MATSPVRSELEILDLRHFASRQLRPLLEEEARVWRERLRWDYDSSTELLLQYLESHVLQGYAAVERGRVYGYSFAVYEGSKAVIGDAFAAGRGAAGNLSTTRTLLVHMLEMLRHSPMVDRIEMQLLLSDASAFAAIFQGPSFRVYPRLFLECDLHPGPQLARSSEVSGRLSLPTRMSLMPWTAQDFQPAGELIHAAYSGHMDAEINDQYRTLHGALRFLHNIVRFPGCGVFDPAHSWVLRDRDERNPVGLVLASRVSGDVAHITQFCVAPQYRGQRLGLLLLEHSIGALRRSGLGSITLTVTEANEPAMRLYERLGFRQRHRFDAVVVDPAR